ncbi:MAG: hypothetical protein H0X64_14970, partial [Gemmatimonadaceae bacterium]|nr:hypothetical protein [Gemmatimonadaceae bacterium]
YRSWGKDGKVLGSIDSERNFTADHDLMKSPDRSRGRHPQRIAFGLPHNYGQPNGKVEPAADGIDRRASPLFIHIHQAAETDVPVAVVAFLPAAFLPPRHDKIRVGSEQVRLQSHDLWKPVAAFMDRMGGKSEKPVREPIVGEEVRLA